MPRAAKKSARKTPYARSRPTTMTKDTIPATSAATDVNAKYNLLSAEMRLVSSDNILFCVPAKTLQRSTVFQDMLNIGPPAGNIANANANADANQEICLVDETLETAAVLELTLSLEDCIHLHMVHESQWPSWERLTRALFLAGKYEFEVAYALALSYLLLVLQRHSSSRPQRLVDLFALAITHDDERAAAFAAGGLLREAAGHSHPIAMYTTPASQLPGPAGTYWTALHKAYAQFPRNYIWCSQCTPGAKTHHAQCLRDKNGPVLTGDMSPSAAFLAYLQAERKTRR